MARPTLHARAALTALPLGLALLAGACDNAAPTAAPAEALHTLTTAEKTVLVGFRTHPGDAEAALIERLGGTVVHRYRYVPVIAARIPVAKESLLKGALGVAYVEDDQRLVAFGGRQVTDYGVALVEAPAAWALGARGQGVKVGIFDSGVDVQHPDLEVLGGIDLVHDGYGYDDCNGHGTHVAGIVGAKANGHHTVGVAPRTSLYSMRLLDCAGSGVLSQMIAGLEWAIDNGMQVVNMSFGSPLPTGLSAAGDAALQAAYDRGIVLVAASGNASAPSVGYPAAHPAVIAVGATDDQDLIAEFSQWGTAQELTAPGVDNLSAYPVGQGVETSLTVPSDEGRELEAIPLAFSGMTRRQGHTAATVYVGAGSPVDFAAVDCVGKTAVAVRGGLSFAEKTQFAMDAGCAAIIIHNFAPGGFNGTLGAETTADGRPWIPAISVSLEDGLYLKEQIEAGPTTTTVVNAPGNLAVLSGTSMASPHASGVAALVLSRNPHLTAPQVRQILRSSSVDLGTPGWDPVFGYGRVNALRAVQQAQ